MLNEPMMKLLVGRAAGKPPATQSVVVRGRGGGAGMPGCSGCCV